MKGAQEFCKFCARIRPDLKDWMDKEADRNCRSSNAELNYLIEAAKESKTERKTMKNQQIGTIKVNVGMSWSFFLLAFNTALKSEKVEDIQTGHSSIITALACAETINQIRDTLTAEQEEILSENLHLFAESKDETL